MMEITLVKAWPGDRDRAYLKVGDVARRAPVHVIHDLPHLVVESLFGITDGLWGELAAGSHAAASRATTARDPKRHKQGRIVSGAAAGARTSEWLTPGHRRAKTITNCVTNRWGDGPDTPAGVRDRAARQHDPSLEDLLAGVNDETITVAIRGVRDLEERWMAVPPGGKLRLSWPLARDFFQTRLPRLTKGSVRAVMSMADHPARLRVPDLGGQPGPLRRIRRQVITDAGAPAGRSRPAAGGSWLVRCRLGVQVRGVDHHAGGG